MLQISMSSMVQSVQSMQSMVYLFFGMHGDRANGDALGEDPAGWGGNFGQEIDFA